jgi:hypothetical protein
MNKFMIILSLLVFAFSQVVAEDTRDAVREEILKSIVAVEQARQDAVNELRETVRDVEAARAMREGEQKTEETIQTKTVESQAVSKIEKSTALVEKAKINAKKSIVKAVSEVEKVKVEKGTAAEVETAKIQAIQSIAKAVSSVEVAKAKAAKVIIEETGKVELSKMQTEHKPMDEVAAPTVAKNITVVEVTRTVTIVELGEVLKSSDENKIKSSYPTKFIRFHAK